MGTGKGKAKKSGISPSDRGKAVRELLARKKGQGDGPREGEREPSCRRRAGRVGVDLGKKARLKGETKAHP